MSRWRSSTLSSAWKIEEGIFFELRHRTTKIRRFLGADGHLASNISILKSKIDEGSTIFEVEERRWHHGADDDLRSNLRLPKFEAGGDSSVFEVEERRWDIFFEDARRGFSKMGSSSKIGEDIIRRTSVFEEPPSKFEEHPLSLFSDLENRRNHFCRY